MARFQVRQGIVMRSPLTRGDEAGQASTWAPLGDDTGVNRAESCRPLGRDIDSLTTAEFEAWKAKHEPLVKKQAAVLDELFSAMNAAARKVDADDAKIKKVQKLPDGGVRLSMKNLYGGASCVHTGPWRFNGTFWTHCDYAPAPEKEIYPFTVTFAAERIPKQGLQVGDVVMFWSLLVKPGADARSPKEGAEHEGLMVTHHVRGTKGLLQIPSFERPMDCVRYD